MSGNQLDDDTREIAPVVDDAPKAKSESVITPDENDKATIDPKPGVGRRTGERTGKVKVRSGAARPTRKARLRISRVDPWSVMKTALMFSVAAAIMVFVAVALLWGIIEVSGTMNKLQEMLNALLGNADGSGTVEISNYIDRWRVLGFTAIASVINAVLLTAIATLAAFLYNLSSSVLGGLEVTLAED